jgi:hypothetical protein
MWARKTWFVALCGFALAAAVPSRAAETTPTLVVRIASIETLTSSLQYLAAQAGRQGEAKQINNRIKMVFPKGFPGIDTRRPLGAYATLDPEGNPQDITGAVLVPITDEQEFLHLLANFKLNLRKGDDGIYEGSLPIGVFPVYLRFANQYAYVTIKDKSILASEKLLAPSKILAVDQSEVGAVNFRVDQIPKSIRDLLLSQFDAQLSNVEEEKPAGETEANHALKVQVTREVGRQVNALLKEGSELSLRFDLDRAAGALAVQVSVAGKPNSSLAAAIAGLARNESLFAGLAAKDSAMNELVHMALPDSMRPAFGKAVEEGIQSGLQKEKDPAKRAATEKLVKALLPSLKAAELDAAFDLRRPSGSTHYTLVGGIKLHKGEELEQTLRDLVQELPPEVRAGIKLDVETVNGVKIHEIEIQKQFDANARRNLGDNPLVLAFRSDAVLLAVGANGLSALKEALTLKPAPAPLLRLELSLARLAPLMNKTPKGGDPQAAAREAFGAGKDNDTVRIVIEGGTALRIRLEGKAPVIKFLSLVDQKNKGR